jgi:hypothetical protein
LAFDSGAGELLTRYISNSSQIRNSDNTIKHNAFMPPKSGRLSVYWISGLQEATVWDIGNDHVAPIRGQIIARADVNSLAAYENQLSVVVTGLPHARHADIVGWNLNSTQPRLQAIKLAKAATLRRAPAPLEP